MEQTGRIDEVLERLGLDCPAQGVVSRQPAARWEDSLIAGNGTLGLLIPGAVGAESITFSHERLFMPIAPRHGPPPLAAHLDEVRGMLARGEWGRAAEFLVALGTANGVPGHTWTDPFVSAFQLHVEPTNESTSTAEAYARLVDYRTGLATVAWESGGCRHRRDAFVSRAEQVVAIRLTADGTTMSCRLRLGLLPPDETSADYVEEHVLPFETTADEAGWLTCHTRFRKQWPGGLRGCAGVLRVVTDGRLSRSGDALIVENARHVLLLGGIELLHEDPMDALPTLKRRLEALRPDFDALLADHARIHGRLFGRTRLQLGGIPAPASSEQLIAASDMGRLAPDLVQRLFDAGRYAVICSTGELPPALQGIWNGTWSAAWSGDFTLNGNVQSAIACGLMAGIPEATLAFCDYLESLMDDFRTNARVLYDARGIMVPSRASAHGLEIHFRIYCPMSYWTAGAAWAAAFFYDYWRYSRDRDFLENRAVPFMLAAAALYEDFIIFDGKGQATFNPSYSPENTSPNAERAACVNATMDVAAVKELLRHLLSLTGEVDLPADRVRVWKRLLEAMPPYQVDDEGCFKEWLHPDLPENHNHRHASHLYPLYHVPDPEVVSSPELIEACKRSIDRRLAYRRGKNGAEMAFGIVQLGLAATNLRDTTLAYECVEWLCNRYWTSAFTSLHDPGRIFNTDISGGLPAVVAQMLLKSGDGELELLPCLPEQWPDGTVSGLAARGGFGVDLQWRAGRLESVTIRANADRQCRILYAGRSVELVFDDDRCRRLDADLRPIREDDATH